MKFILFFIAILFSCCGFSQQNLKYVDSLKRIINKGIPETDDGKATKRQIAYIKACDVLGDYYKSIHQEKTALRYYLLVAKLREGTDGDLEDNEYLILLRNNICIKTGDLYLRGISVKNFKLSLYYHSKGLISKTIKLRNYYSKIYFNNTVLFFPISDFNSTDSTLLIAINPIYFTQHKFLFSKVFENKLKPIVSILLSDTTLNCLVKINFGPSLPADINGEASISKHLYYIKNYFLKKNIPEEKIQTNMSIDEDGCNYKDYDLPCLQVIVSKKK